VGTYILNINPKLQRGLAGPIIQIWQERALWLKYAIGAAVASGFAIPFEGRIVGLSNHLFAPGMQLFFGWGIFWGLTALLRREYRFQPKLPMKQVVGWCIAMGACFIVANAFSGAAFYYGVSASVGALKRLDGPVTVILATIFLKEKGTGYRLIGTLIIALGAFLIVLGR
jgi:drug/metabolite transporter (DMT)-like permease